MRNPLVTLAEPFGMDDWRIDFVVLDDLDGESVMALRVGTVMDRVLLAGRAKRSVRQERSRDGAAAGNPDAWSPR